MANSEALNNAFKLKVIVSVMQPEFGAKADGTNDAAAFTAALASGASEITVPKGTFTVTSAAFTLTNAELKGFLQSIVKGTAALNLFTLDSESVVDGMEFDTFARALMNDNTTDTAINAIVQRSDFINGATAVIDIAAPIERLSILNNKMKANKGPNIRAGENTYSLQAGWKTLLVAMNVIEDVDSTGSAGTVGGILSYVPFGKIIGNDIRDVLGGVGDETFAIYTKGRHGIIALNTLNGLNTTGTTIYGINLKGVERGNTSAPQGYGALALGNVMVGSGLGGGIQMQADQQSAIGNFLDNFLIGIECGTSVLHDNLILGNRSHSAGGISSRGIAAAVSSGERLIDAMGIHRNVRYGIRYVCTGTNMMDRLLVAGQHLECDTAAGDRGVYISAATAGNITNVHVKDITCKNHSRAVDLEGVYGGIIENIRATGLTTATRPINLVDCKNIIGRDVWQYEVQTTDATATLVYQMAISNGNRLVIRARAHARKSDGTAEAYIEQEFLFDMEGGTAALVASGTARVLGAGGVGGLSGAITSNRPAVRVTGIIAETWDWTVWIDFDLR